MLSYLLTFMAGLMTNVMPCNFSTLLLRVRYSISGYDEKHRSLLILSQVSGVHIGFFIISVAAVAATKAGADIIWGGYLSNSIAITFTTILVMFVAMHQFLPNKRQTPIGTCIGTVADKLDHKTAPTVPGAIISGLVTVLLSLECSGPILAATIGKEILLYHWSHIIILCQFFALGVSCPFLILASMPKILNKMPKPGPWTEIVSSFAALPLFFIAGLGMLSLFERQEYFYFYLVLVSSFSMICHSFFLRIAKWINATIITAGIFICLITMVFEASKVSNIYRPYNQLKLEKLLEQKQNVLLIISSDMCLHCKIGDIRLTHSENIKTAVQSGNLVIMIARFGGSSDEKSNLGKLLNSFGAKRVPFHVLYDSHGNVHPLDGFFDKASIDKILAIIYE